MSNFASVCLPEAMRSIDSSTFTGSYQTVGSVLANPSRILLFVNNSNVLVTVSFDGTTDAFPLLPGATFVLDLTANAVAAASLCVKKGTQFYAKGSAGSGSVYIATFYAN